MNFFLSGFEWLPYFRYRQNGVKKKKTKMTTNFVLKIHSYYMTVARDEDVRG